MNRNELYVVTGANGRTGSSTAHALIKAGKQVRVVLRDKTKENSWIEQGAEVAVACLTDTTALSRAFTGADAAYIISPQQYAADDLFTQADTIAHTIANAASKAQLPKMVALSSIGADRASGAGWIGMNRILEQHLNQTGIPTIHLRAAYFMENWETLLKSAVTQNELPSFLAPLEQKLPMIATQDIGRIAAEILCKNEQASRIIELEGPERYSPNDVASSLSQTLNKTINASPIPESHWAQALSTSGMSKNAIQGFIEMTRSLNDGGITFTNENKNIERIKGKLSLEVIIKRILSST